MNLNCNLDGPKVAVIGAGPGGIVAARWLLRHGCYPTVFEASASLGGQWNGECRTSATWPSLRTNTSREFSRFSDLSHAEEVPLYPRRDDMLQYLDRYCDRFGLHVFMRVSTAVRSICKEGAQWTVTSVTGEGDRRETFDWVVIASGHEARPQVPEVEGLGSFSGGLGVIHSAQYRGADRYRGRSVLVAGCSVSALEIASDLAWNEAREVISCYRRQRYVLPKLAAGIPMEALLMTRAAAFSGERLPLEVMAQTLSGVIDGLAGSPERYGARKSDPDVMRAGITQSQGFLPAVAEGRIAVAPWIESVTDDRVTFADGTSRRVDGIVLGTGFRPDLRMLDPALAQSILADDGGLDLCGATFHPAAPGLACLGLYNLVGPKLPVLELQARWISRVIAGEVGLPSDCEMTVGIAQAKEQRLMGAEPMMNATAISFARRAGLEPDLHQFPKLARALLFGPMVPESFRLQGPDALAEAPARVAALAKDICGLESGTFTPEEVAQLDALGEASLL